MQAVHAHGSRDVLDGVLADRLAAERQLARDLIVRRARDADAAALGQTFQTGRNVDAVAVEPLALDDHVAQIDADAEAHPPERRELGIARLELALDVDGALHGVDDARELRQHVVARGVHDAPALAGHARRDQGAVCGDGANGRHFVVARESAVAYDARAQDGGELSLDGASAHAPDGGTIGYAQPIA